MPDAFISYSRGDSREFVERLSAALEERDKDTWVDLDDIPPASKWEQDLREGVAGSDAFCFVISPGSVASDHCRRELDYASERNKRIVPINHIEVGDTEVPEAIGSHNWIPQRGVFEDDFEASVGTLIEAIETDLDWVRAHTRWGERAEEWERRRRDGSLLARGSDLAEAEQFLAAAANRRPEPTGLQGEFVLASRAAASRRQRTRLVLALGALVITAALGVFALIQRNEAIDQRDFARSNELSLSALNVLPSDPELGLILALEAVETKSTQRSERALASAVNDSRLRARAELDGDPYIAGLSPDGRWLVAGTTSGAALFDAASGGPLRRLGPPDPVFDVAFTADSGAALTAGEDGTVRRFSLPDGALEDEIETPGPVASIAVSDEDRVIAVTTETGDLLTFDPDGDPLGVLRGHEGPVASVDFAPRGPALISAGSDRTARLWNGVTGKQLARLEGPSTDHDAAVSEDGRTAVTVGSDGIAREWDVTSGETVGQPLNDVLREGRVASVDLTADASAVVMARQDGSTETGDLETRTSLGILRGHEGVVISAELGADGESVATAGRDRTARVWDLTPIERRLTGSELAVSAAVSPDGAIVATGDGDGRVLLFDGESGERAGSFRAATGPLRDLGFSADGELLASASEDGTARTWNVATGKPASPVLEHDAAVVGLAFDPAGGRLLTGAGDGRARIWDLESGGADDLLRSAHVGEVAWSPDSGLVAVTEQTALGDGSFEYSVRVLDPASGDEIARLVHPDVPLSVAFDDSGERIVTGGVAGFAQIWAARTGEPLVRIDAQQAQIDSARFAPGGRTVVTASVSGGGVYSAATGDVIVTNFQRVRRAEVAPDGSIVQVSSESIPVAIIECEICTADLDRLIALARERITRLPTEEERGLYGL